MLVKDTEDPAKNDKSCYLQYVTSKIIKYKVLISKYYLPPEM